LEITPSLDIRALLTKTLNNNPTYSGRVSGAGSLMYSKNNIAQPYQKCITDIEGKFFKIE
jgi:hypothetical protein